MNEGRSNPPFEVGDMVRLRDLNLVIGMGYGASYHEDGGWSLDSLYEVGWIGYSTRHKGFKVTLRDRHWVHFADRFTIASPKFKIPFRKRRFTSTLADI